MKEIQVQSLGWEDPLEKGMATHSVPAWRIPWTQDPGRLQPMGSQRVGHNWANFTFTFQHNCGFCIVELCHLILEYILNKCGYAISFSCAFLCFLLMTYYLLFILDWGNDVRQKTNSMIFLFRFKMGCKAAETVTTSITHMAQKLLNECTVLRFKKFCKADKSREDKECNG